MLRIFKISGDSLYPLYKHGQRVLCRKILKHSQIKIDDTVVFKKAQYGLMIKTVKNIDKNGYHVEGTNPYSIDSRNFGRLSMEELEYKVLLKF